MIKNAWEMKDISTKNKHYEEGYKQAVESVMKSIENASERGYRKTCFCSSTYWYKNEDGIDCFINFDEEVKAEFIRHGYSFRPTGYIGGVWQHTEDICW